MQSPSSPLKINSLLSICFLLIIISFFLSFTYKMPITIWELLFTLRRSFSRLMGIRKFLSHYTSSHSNQLQLSTWKKKRCFLLGQEYKRALLGNVKNMLIIIIILTNKKIMIICYKGIHRIGHYTIREEHFCFFIFAITDLFIRLL